MFINKYCVGFTLTSVLSSANAHVCTQGLACMHKGTFAHNFFSSACLKQICFPVPQMIFSIREMIPTCFFVILDVLLLASYSQDQTSFFCYSHPVAQTQRLCNYLASNQWKMLLAGVTVKI